MRVATLCILALTVLVWTSSARADVTKLSVAAQGCVPEPASIPKLMQNATGAVTFTPGATGSAFVICPFATPFTNTAGCDAPLRMFLTAADPDGSGTTYYVRAYLAGLPTDTGPVGSIAGVTSFSAGKSATSVEVNHIFDFINNYYYVVVELQRANTAANPAFYGVGLRTDVCL